MSRAGGGGSKLADRLLHLGNVGKGYLERLHWAINQKLPFMIDKALEKVTRESISQAYQ
jgi:hypothetical protein